MNGLAVIRAIAGSVGGLLVVLNALQLTFGFVRLHRALGTENIPQRFADALRTGWVISGTVGILLGIVLLCLLPDLGSASRLAWRVTTVIAAGLVVLGVLAVLATGRHFGLLFFSAMGLSLLVPLLVRRSLFH